MCTKYHLYMSMYTWDTTLCPIASYTLRKIEISRLLSGLEISNDSSLTLKEILNYPAKGNLTITKRKCNISGRCYSYTVNVIIIILIQWMPNKYVDGTCIF